MKRFFAKIACFFWSWGFLKFILWCVTLVIFLYVEEDWRGTRAWATTKAEWEAKGESFELSKFIPPLIPDDQNLAAIPLFKLEPQSKTDSFPYPVTLQRAMRSELPGHDLPHMGLGVWQKGELPDMAKIHDAIATDYTTAFKGVKLPEDVLVQFDALYPFLNDLRTAVEARPFCRFNQDYTMSPPAGRPIALITSQIKLSQLLKLHAILALEHHQPDLALEDLKLNYLLLSGAKRDPTLVGGLVAIGMAAIWHPVISYGLDAHAWNDAQLAEIERTLEPLNFLADYQFAMRCEAAESVTDLDYFQHVNRTEFLKLFGMVEYDFPLTRLLNVPWPGGWWADNKRQMSSFLFRDLTTVDPKSRRVFPKMDAELQIQVQRAVTRWDAYAPWNILFSISTGPLSIATQKYALAQSLVDEARIACALERYRLAHNAYPDSLDALAPAYIDAVPHDVINGESYHYQLRPDGTFQLYSVGWNEKDDGGQVVYRKDAPTQVDYNEGDWAWPTPQK